jgi:hypothetical protein
LGVPGDASARIVGGRVEPMLAFLTEPRTCMLAEPPKLDGGAICAIDVPMVDRALGADPRWWST